MIKYAGVQARSRAIPGRSRCPGYISIMSPAGLTIDVTAKRGLQTFERKMRFLQFFFLVSLQLILSRHTASFFLCDGIY